MAHALVLNSPQPWHDCRVTPGIAKGTRMAGRFFGEGPEVSEGSNSGERPQMPVEPSRPARHPAKPPALAAGVAEPRFALLIGNERYSSHLLETPVADVRMLATLLTQLGFAVEKIENASRAAMFDALARFVERLETAEGGVAFVYFAGHGFQDEGINYLLGVDAEPASSVQLKNAALAIGDIVQAMAVRPRKANVIVVDACRTALGEGRSRTRDVTEGLADLKLPPDATMLVAYSTSAGTIAADVAAQSSEFGSHSPYAAALHQALPTLLEPDRRIHDVFVEAAERVRETSGSTQSPALYLQGAAPPLNATDADRERFANWKRRPKSRRERGLQWIGAATLAALIAASALTWWAAYPETRARWLRVATFSKSDPIDNFQCRSGLDNQDRFGLTLRQWCQLPIEQLLQIVRNQGRWDGVAEESRADAGDAVAMSLLAAAKYEDAAKPIHSRHEKQLVGEAQSYSLRAARAGWLPAWVSAAKYAPFATAPDDRLRSPAVAGVVPAQVAWGIELWSAGNIVKAEEWFAAALRNDPSGTAALRLGEALYQGSPNARFAANMPAAVPFLLTACKQGQAQAVAPLLAFEKAKQRVVAVSEMASCLEQAASAGHVDAMLRLAEIHIGNELGPASSIDAVLAWLRKAAESGSPEARLKRADALAWGLPDQRGKPRVAIDLAGAARLLTPMVHRRDVARTDADREIVALAAKACAELHERRAYSRQSGCPDDARSLAWTIQKMTKDQLLLAFADQVLRRSFATTELWTSSARYARSRASPSFVEREYGGIEIGDNASAIDVVVLMSWGCARCLDLLENGIPAIEAEYVKPGFANVEVRLINAAAFGMVSLDAEKAAACVPMARRREFFIALVSAFRSWSTLPEDERGKVFGSIAGPLGNARHCETSEASHSLDELQRTFRPALDSAELADRDKRRRGNIAASRDASAKAWGVGEKTVVLVDGEKLVDPTLETLRQVIYDRTRPQDRETLTKP